MREIMRIVEGASAPTMTESREELTIGADTVTISINPSQREFSAMLRRFPAGIRGLAAEENIYLWDAMLTAHADVTSAYGLVSSAVPFIIALDRARAKESYDRGLYGKPRILTIPGGVLVLGSDEPLSALQCRNAVALFGPLKGGAKP